MSKDKEFEIEKGIPIPDKRNPGGSSKGQTKYPFQEMEVGDSFLYNDKLNDEKGQRNIANNARNWCKHHQLNWKFIARQISQGVRIWRIK